VEREQPAPERLRHDATGVQVLLGGGVELVDGDQDVHQNAEAGRA
jgi:hypothetical protein